MRVVDKTHRKAKTWNDIKKFDHEGPENLEWCIQRLKSGIKATKYNFSNYQSKQVQVRFLEASNEISYYSNESKSFWNLLKGPTIAQIENFKGIIYGG